MFVTVKYLSKDIWTKITRACSFSSDHLVALHLRHVCVHLRVFKQGQHRTVVPHRAVVFSRPLPLSFRRFPLSRLDWNIDFCVISAGVLPRCIRFDCDVRCLFVPVLIVNCIPSYRDYLSPDMYVKYSNIFRLLQCTYRQTVIPASMKSIKFTEFDFPQIG